jgi:hypothetical protein
VARGKQSKQKSSNGKNTTQEGTESSKAALPSWHAYPTFLRGRGKKEDGRRKEE